MSPVWTPPTMASGKKKATPAKRKRGKRKRRKSTPAGNALTIMWGCIGLGMLGLAYAMEAEMWVVGTAVSWLIGAVSYWVDTRPNATVPPPAGSPGRTAKPPKNAGSGGGSRKPGTAVICTQSGLPTDQCKGNHMHVMSQGGLQRYGKKHGVKQIGDPYGTKADKRSTASTAGAKQQRVPMTNNAKPQPSGTRMKRVV